MLGIKGDNIVKNLIILDDDTLWLKRLSSSFERRGYTVHPCQSLKEAREALERKPFHYAVFDLKLEDGISLQILERAQQSYPRIKIVILTGYGNFATAVSAIKHGAINYLAKPVDTDDIEASFLEKEEQAIEPEQELLSANRVKWEYIQRILVDCHQNISETARRLKMHRRTLQRILAKHAPRE